MYTQSSFISFNYANNYFDLSDFFYLKYIFLLNNFGKDFNSFCEKILIMVCRPMVSQTSPFGFIDSCLCISFFCRISNRVQRGYHKYLLLVYAS